MSNEFKAAVSAKGKLTIAQKALALVKEFPFRTTSELARKVNPDIISHEDLHKRLPELAKKGLVCKAYARECTVTGKMATVWRHQQALSE